MARLLNSFTRDINAGHEDALQYAKLDAFTLKVLWWNFAVLILFVFATSYLQLANYIQSPFAWRVISPKEAFATLAVGLIAVSIPIFFRNSFKTHYYYRLLLTTSLIVFSYLFVFITGGAIEAHFHFFIVIGYIAVYADWRLGWLTFFLTIVHHTVLDFVAPTWVFFYGENWLSPLAHGIPVLAAVVLTSVISNMQRGALLAQKDLEKRREEFISMASHELKTPVTSISILTEVLEKSLADKNMPELSMPILTIKDQVRKITKLISDLLDASRIGLFGLTYSFASFDLNALISEVVSTIREFDAHRLIHIRGSVSENVFGDKDRISQALMNLLTNAIKYSPESSPIQVDIAREGTMAVVCITDQGIGIDEKYHSKIFERFYRVYDDDEKTYPGMGIGLNISSEIIERHAGKMWVESSKGGGSKFYFSLPFAQ